jgi:hypothetical protein
VHAVQNGQIWGRIERRNDIDPHPDRDEVTTRTGAPEVLSRPGQNPRNQHPFPGGHGISSSDRKGGHRLAKSSGAQEGHTGEPMQNPESVIAEAPTTR